MSQTDRLVQRGETPVARGKADEFVFSDYAAALAQRLAKEEAPFTLGIFGRWGAGKTTLMRLIEEEIEKNEPKDSVLSIWFNAWKYDREEAIWRALLIRTIDALESYLTVSKSGERKLKPEYFKKDAREAYEQLQRTKTSLYRTVEERKKGQVEINLTQLAKGGLKLGLPMLTGGLPAVEFLKKLLGIGKAKDGAESDDQRVSAIKDILSAFQRQEQIQYFEKIQFLNDFHHGFETAIERLVDSDQIPLKKVNFFIDDLDRCLPDKAIQVFEAIKLFLDNQYCIFVLGVDEQAIQAGIEHRYQNFFINDREEDAKGKESELAEVHKAHVRRLFKEEYLEKIIQLPFFMPDITHEHIVPFVRERLDLNWPMNDSGHSEGIGLLPELCAAGVEPNPRKIKRLCYSINLVSGIVCARGLHESLYPEILVKLLIIQHRDQALYRRVCEKPLLLRFIELYWKEEERLGEQEERLRKEESLRETPVRRSKNGNSEPPKRPKNEYAQYAHHAKGSVWIKPLLQWQPETNEVQIATFEKVGHLREYLSLTATAQVETSETQAEVMVTALDTQVLTDLLHEDLSIIESAAVSRIDEKALPKYQTHLLEYCQDPSNPWRKRVSAGDAVGFIGDPRFELERPWQQDSHWIAIAAGEFYRGSRKEDQDSESNEIDGGRYALDDFQIARYPVTNSEYQQFVRAGNHQAPTFWTKGEFPTGKGNHPVVNVSWHDATAYVEWLNGLNDGHTYSLPTEAQWERAARGPAIWQDRENRRRYPWGEKFDQHKCNVAETGLDRTTSVGCFVDGASPEGVLELAGNVWEWCADWYDNNYYQQKTIEENKKEAQYKVLRGGSFDYRGVFARCAFRHYYGFHPEVDYHDLGFRVARINP